MVVTQLFDQTSYNVNVAYQLLLSLTEHNILCCRWIELIFFSILSKPEHISSHLFLTE